jgi:hypothetical protein
LGAARDKVHEPTSWSHLFLLHIRAWGNLGSEGVGVPLQGGLHGFLPDGLVLRVVAAVEAIAVHTVIARGKTLAVPALQPVSSH